MQAFDGFISAVASEFNIRFHKDEKGNYTTKIKFEGNHSKEILISLTNDESGDRIINYYSIIGILKKDLAELYKFCLEQNASLDYGAFALLNEMLVLRNTSLLKDCDPHRFVKVLLYIAAKADELEELFVKNAR